MPDKAAKPIIGLAGGIGSGKSSAAAILEELGARVIDSDRQNHEELNSPEVLSVLRQWWGNRVVTADGRADREAIRAIVAGDPAQRKRLEQLVHPRIAQKRAVLDEQYARDPAVRAIVWDTPLLYEVGLADKCDRVIFVEADDVARRNRVLQAKGWTPQELEKFEQSQLPLDIKRQLADYIVVNNSGLDDLRRQLMDVLSQILSGA